MPQTNQLRRKRTARRDIGPLERLKLCKIGRVNEVITDDSLLVLRHMREEHRELRNGIQCLSGDLYELGLHLSLVLEDKQVALQTGIEEIPGQACQVCGVANRFANEMHFLLLREVWHLYLVQLF